MDEGYECSFVEQPPSQIQTHCMICQSILRDPSQLNCGHLFCAQCIETSLQYSTNTCPVCKQQKHSLFPDVNLKRQLAGFRVYCEKGADEGGRCGWVGEFGQLDAHLNEKPSRGTKYDGCQYVKLKCRYCKEKVKRSDLRRHQEFNCPNRRHTCLHCNYTSDYIDVTVHHICPNILLLCDFCGSLVRRGDMDVHTSEVCDNIPLECDFKLVGCHVGLTRGDLVLHFEEYRAIHEDLLRKKLDKIKFLQERINYLEQDNNSNRQRQRYDREKQEVRKATLIENCRANEVIITAMKTKVKKLEKVLRVLVTVLVLLLSLNFSYFYNLI